MASLSGNYVSLYGIDMCFSSDLICSSNLMLKYIEVDVKNLNY
jgi:hypothetical protein